MRSHHLVDCLATALPEGGVHFPDGVGVKRMTRAVDVAANDRVTGLLRATSVLLSKNGQVLLTQSYMLKCTPAQRMF